MKTDWKEFLENAGAVIDDDRVNDFGNPQRELQVATTGSVIADLSHLGLISVHGADAESFLQGQFCNDVREVSESHSQISGYNSPKGRLLAVFRLFRHGDGFYLLLPQALVNATLKRLRLFVLNAKATPEDASNAMIRIGLSGPDAEAELQDALGTAPAQADAMVAVKDLVVIRIPGPHPRFEIMGDIEAVKKVWSTLDVRAAPVGAAPWSLLDIRAGLPVVYPQTMDSFVPQMVNLQAVGGVSFRKGCYTGQEVVARMHFLGKLKRRMYRARLRCDHAPKPGDRLFAAGADGGTLVDAQPSPDGGYEVLAVVPIAAAEGGPIHLHDRDGPLLEFIELPYDPETQDG